MAVTDPTTTETRRFSIRLPPPLCVGLLAVVLIGVAIVLGIGLPFYRQHSAIREIERHSGWSEVRYDGPEWLRELIGPEDTQFFDVVTSAGLGGTDFCNADMAFLGGLGTVERLVLYNTHITDSGLAHVRSLRKLNRLYLHGTRVTDAGIVHLKALSQLQVLDLARTGITDAGLAQLREIRSLKRLYVEGSQATDAGIAELQDALPELTIIR